MNLLLIYLRSKNHYSEWNPLSIESLAGHLKGVFQEKINITMFDTDSVSDDLVKLVSENEMIGFSISSFTLDTYVEILETLDLSKKIVILGNQLPTYLSREMILLTMSRSNAKKENIIISSGEGEKSLEEAVRNYRNGKIYHKESIANLCFYDEKGNYTETIKQVPDLKQLPFPPLYSKRENKKYAQVQLSRGCYWGKCSFCTRKSYRFGNKWESFSLERIKKDLYEVMINQEIETIEFCDDEFFGGASKECLKRAYDIANYINELAAERGKKVQYRLFTRPDFIANFNKNEGNEEIKKLLTYMKTTGLTRIYMGIESGCNSQLNRYSRGFGNDMIKKAIQTLNEIKMNFDSGFILFDPNLTLEEILENVAFYKEMNLIETNQWIWRPLIANFGSTIGEELSSNQEHSSNLNEMAIKYSFTNPYIKEIFEIVDQKSEETRYLFYALKSISKKDYDYSDESKYNTIAHELVKKNGMVYMDLLEKLASLALDIQPYDSIAFKERTSDICFDVDSQIQALICEIEFYCSTNIFYGNDKEILLKQINLIKGKSLKKNK